MHIAVSFKFLPFIHKNRLQVLGNFVMCLFSRNEIILLKSMFESLFHFKNQVQIFLQLFSLWNVAWKRSWFIDHNFWDIQLQKIPMTISIYARRAEQDNIFDTHYGPLTFSKYTNPSRSLVLMFTTSFALPLLIGGLPYYPFYSTI